MYNFFMCKSLLKGFKSKEYINKTVNLQKNYKFLVFFKFIIFCGIYFSRGFTALVNFTDERPL